MASTDEAEGELALSALSAMSSGILIVDADERVLFANRRTAELFQRSVEELRALKLRDFLAPLESLLATQKKPRTEERSEVTAKRPDGSSILIGFSFSRLDGRRTTQYACVLQDISGYVSLRRERDALLRRAIVAELLPSILHELRNPLASMTTAVELLLEEVNDESVQRDLRSVFKEIRRMDLGLQGFAVAGRDLRSRQENDVSEAIREALRIIEPLAADANISLRNQTADLPRVAINGDVLRGVVFNLVRSAISGCGAGNTIRVAARVSDRTSFELSVTDDGPTPPAHISDTPGAMRVGGRVGNALRLSKSAVEAAGGSLVIESVGGSAGTRVILRIPGARVA
jgi:nitrogen-specific signal transduction histidine kinase